MRPRIKSSTTPTGRVWWVAWEHETEFIQTPFWTWPAALDFAVERVLDFKKINHLHLWQ